MTDGPRKPIGPSGTEPFSAAASSAADLSIYPRNYDGLHRSETRQVQVPYPPPLTAAEYEQFRIYVLERTGLEVPEYRPQLLSRGLVDAIQSAGCSSLQQFHARLRSSLPTSPLWDELIGVLTIGETYFFRHTNHFDVLTKHVLPEILAQRRQSDRRLRIWSAGCATGEEPYSLAILLSEMILNLDSWNILILATDINREALAKAQEGLYAAWSFRGVDKRIQDTFFKPKDDGPLAFRQFAIADRLKRMVNFSYLNLVADPYPSLLSNTNGMDIILCRNVTIYFKPEVTHRVVRNLSACLVEGGWLIPGPSEPNMVYYDALEPRNFPGTVIYRKPKASETRSATPPIASVAPAFAVKPSPALPAFRPKPLPPPAPPDPYQVALDLLKSGRTDEALAKLYEKLDQNADYGPTYYTLAKVYANKGNLGEAQNWCERAISRDRLRPEPYYLLSLVNKEQGLYDRAMELLKKALYLNREFTLAHYHLAQLLRGSGEMEQSTRSFQNVQRLLKGQSAEDLVPEGEGMTVGRLLELVTQQLGDDKPYDASRNRP